MINAPEYTKLDLYCRTMSKKIAYHIVSPKSQEEESVNYPLPQKENRHYSYNYSYNYPWVNVPKGVAHRCDFDGDGYMELNDSELTVFEDWQTRKFSLSQVLGMEIGFRRLMAPLIIGGIVAPLSFLAAFNSEFNFWISIASFLIGLLLFYYGLQGSYQVTIKLIAHEFKFFIDEKSEAVEGFVRYVNRLM